MVLTQKDLKDYVRVSYEGEDWLIEREPRFSGLTFEEAQKQLAKERAILPPIPLYWKFLEHLTSSTLYDGNGTLLDRLEKSSLLEQFLGLRDPRIEWLNARFENGELSTQTFRRNGTIQPYQKPLLNHLKGGNYTTFFENGQFNFIHYNPQGLPRRDAMNTERGLGAAINLQYLSPGTNRDSAVLFSARAKVPRLDCAAYPQTKQADIQARAAKRASKSL